MPHPSQTLRSSSFGSWGNMTVSTGYGFGAEVMFVCDVTSPVMGLTALAAPAGVNGPTMSRPFVAAMELAIWEASGHTAGVCRPPIGSQIAWHQRTPFQHFATSFCHPGVTH